MVTIALLKVLRYLFSEYVFTIKIGLARGLKRKYGFGFKPRLTLTREEKFLMRLDFEGRIVFDVGSYIGIYTMFFARAVGKQGKVVAFEPNPGNYHELLNNLKLNNFSNVIPLNIGLGKTHIHSNLVLDPLYPSRGIVQSYPTGKIANKRGVKTISVEIYDLDSLMKEENLLNPDFIKVDVEGFEVDVLRGMTETINGCKPDLFIEIHEGSLIREIIEFLVSKGYSIFHVETDKFVNDDNWQIEEGHFFCKKLYDE